MRLLLKSICKVVLANLPKGYAECMGYGMIGNVVPHSLFSTDYHCDPTLPLPFANLASQKNHMALYLMNVYGDPATEQWFRKAWQAAGKKLDMGKACVRFKKIQGVPFEVVGQIIARVPVKDYTARVERVTGATAKQGGKPKPAKPKKTK